ncbi:MAG: TrkA family potassium uptake protein [Lachnospiraceae bacterium]|nr:TrkA family potassium uptake protein [Lachnospiraceae bacterium]
MNTEKTYAVFGLGRYGIAVARELVAHGSEVIAVDINEVIVNDMSSDIPICKCADVTDPEAVKQLGIANVDVVVISMASNLEASVMAIMLCKELGVKKIIAKCANEMHRKILSRVGADVVVLPESDSGVRLAKNLLSSGFVDIIELSQNVSLVELDVKPDWVNHSIIELDLRKKYDLNIIAIREEKGVCTSIKPDMVLKEGMKLIVVVNTSRLSKL